MEARDIPAGEGYLISETKGEIEKEGNVLVIRRVHVTYHLKIADEHRETAGRVHAFHAEYCPVARTIRNCVEISTTLEMESI
ncbi:MAG: OsmC family protein [Anaerolineales bacterium]